MAIDSDAECRIPVAVESDTIVESIFEIRFDAAVPNASDLLPGMLYPRLKSDYPTSMKLPAAEIPRAILRQQPNLAFVALHRLEGESGSVSVGDRVLTLSVIRPYPGWSGFRNQIIDVVEKVKSTGLITSVSRVALRYSNIIQPGNGEYDLSPLDVELKLNSFDIRDRGTHIRSEISRNNCVNIVQIATSTTLMVRGKEPITGVLLDVDTQRAGPFGDFWVEFEIIIEEIHQTEKEIFFGLLTGDSVMELGPTWPR